MPPTGPTRSPRSPWFWLGIALAIVPVQAGAWSFATTTRGSRDLAFAAVVAFVVLSFAQVVLGLRAVVAVVRRNRAGERGSIAAACCGVLASCIAAVAGSFGALAALFAAGGGWGRPLRVHGRQTHPALRAGSDWTAGPRPDPDALGLDAPTRRALEALWLHDAQKEHASVPAFARVSWLLAAAGAPAELLAWCQRAAIEEIEHAQLCFALAAGYGGRHHTVEPMPQLLRGGADLRGDALVLLATESLADGCLLEDFNADVAAACAAVCEEPATQGVLEQIAREERNHAELSWAIVAWALAQSPAAIGAALARATEALPRYRRPTAVSRRAFLLVQRADAERLRRCGRLPDSAWRAAWRERVAATTARAQALLGTREGPDGPAAPRAPDRPRAVPRREHASAT